MLKNIKLAFKKMFFWIVDFFDSMARAQAAAELTRQGHHDAARRLMSKD